MQPLEQHDQNSNDNNQPYQPTESAQNPAPHSVGQVFTPNSQPESQELNNPNTISMPTSETPTMVSGSSMAKEENSKNNKFKFSKKFALIGLVPLLFIGGGAAAYYGYVVPNKPENIWAIALSNTGKAYDKLAGYINTANYDNGTKLNGTLKASSAEFAVDGNIDGSSDKKGNSQYSGAVSTSGIKVNYDLRTIASSGQYPDVYFKLSGVQGLGSLLSSYLGTGTANDPQAAQYKKALDGINDQWYFVDHTLFDKEAQNTDTLGLQSITKDDVNNFIKAVGEPSKKYIFTSDESYMAIVVKQNVGREVVDNVETYHYKAGVNKDNLKKWNKEICDNLKNNTLYKSTIGIGQSQASLERQCYDTSDIDKLKDSDTADVWVDLKTKLPHKVRFTDKKDAKNYFDIIQNFQGGSKIPVTLAFSEESNGTKVNGEVNFEYDTSTSGMKITSKLKATGKEAAEGSFNLTITPNNSDVKVEKPTNSKNIMQLVEDLGLTEFLQGPTLTPQASSPTLQ